MLYPIGQLIEGDPELRTHGLPRRHAEERAPDLLALLGVPVRKAVLESGRRDCLGRELLPPIRNRLRVGRPALDDKERESRLVARIQRRVQVSDTNQTRPPV